MRSPANAKSPPPRRLWPIAVIGIGAAVIVAAVCGSRLLITQPRTAAGPEPEPSAVASIAGRRSTTVIISSPNSNDCRRYELNVATGARNEQSPIDCPAGNANRPGRIEAISKSFRSR